MAPQPIVRARRISLACTNMFADDIRSWSKQLIQWDKEDRLKAEQSKGANE